MSFIIVYITNPNEEVAKKVVLHLIEKRIAACGNIFPIKSAYWWKGNIENDDEIAAIVKTQKKNWGKIQKEVKKIHPYKVPCIMKIDVEANKDYEDWINKETHI